MTQEKLIERARKWGDRDDACFCSECLCDFARAALKKAEQAMKPLANDYGMIQRADAEQAIRKLME